MREYDPKEIEPKWQKSWAESGLHHADDPSTDSGRAKQKKCYVLDMFPYPSGAGLHVGHPKGYIATDIYSRFKRMNGYSVLHPMGWDAFGLPAEEFAIKNKTHPREAVEKNIARYKEQLSIIGFNYDWEREINTTDPKYYRWTQWIFLQMYKKGLAFESHEPINWCPSCKTGLANEDLDGNKCERCGSIVEKKPLRQWVLRITDYADKLLEGLEKLDWPLSIKESQKNWIGRSEGAVFKFILNVPGQPANKHFVEIFTTRADTMFGATFVAVSPELAKKWIDVGWQANSAMKKYIEQALEHRAKDPFQSERHEKTGIDAGIMAINPATEKEIPVWVTDYVLGDVGTGAIMAVPAHDERDYAFAKKFNLPIVEVVSGGDVQKEAYEGEGELVNSGEHTGEASLKARASIVKSLKGKKTVSYKLKDWVFSRQRYWGEPIPLVHCAKCGVVPVPEKDLPVLLPDVQKYEPTGTGESPLANISDWVNTECPKCGGAGKRETNTMPQWAGSCWYYLRYMDPHNKKALVETKKEKYWSPVDMYVGGAEHATRHLIYARFWHKFLYDIGVVSTDEPFVRLQHVGLIQGEDGRKMSKRYGNVINPDDVVATYGADTLRLFEMFMGPFDQNTAWSTESIIGPRRFLERVWKLPERIEEGGFNGGAILHKTIQGVGEDIEAFDMNTAVSKLMILINELEKNKTVSKESVKIFLRLLAPFAPHITEELWYSLGEDASIHSAPWPEYDNKKLVSETAKFAIQIAGKLRDVVEAARDASETEVYERAIKLPKVAAYLAGKQIKKKIFVPEKLLNIVTE